MGLSQSLLGVSTGGDTIWQKPNIRWWWLIEIIQVFEIVNIITDIKLIHATYLIFAATVKSESLEIWPSVNKKGRIHVLDSPSWVVITKKYPNGFFWKSGVSQNYYVDRTSVLKKRYHKNFQASKIFCMLEITHYFKTSKHQWYVKQSLWYLFW